MERWGVIFFDFMGKEYAVEVNYFNDTNSRQYWLMMNNQEQLINHGLSLQIIVLQKCVNEFGVLSWKELLNLPGDVDEELVSAIGSVIDDVAFSESP